MAKIARIIGGFSLIIAGIALLVLPGPGIITIVGGLALLAQDIPWAGRLRDWVKERYARFMSEPSSESDG